VVLLKLIKRFYAIIFLTLVVAISATLLGLTHSLTADQILRQEHARFMAYLERMFPDMDYFEHEEELYVIYNVDDEIEGYAFIGSAPGYSSTIRVMVGLEDKATVKQVMIIAHTETPGIGDRIEDEDFTGQFAGLPVDRIYLNSDDVDSITGATQSANAVIRAISEAVEEIFKEQSD